MAASTLERRPAAWLDEHAREWVDHGLISDAQAGAIRHFEHLDQVEEPPRLTVVAEVASYLGSVIAFAGGAAIVGPNWERIGLLGQLAVGAAIAVIGFVAGTWLVHEAEPGTVRLGTFLWTIGTGGVALAAGAFVNAIDPRDDGWFGVMIGVPVLAVGLVLWRNLERPLQLVTSVVGLAITAAGLGGLIDVPVRISSPVVWGGSLLVGVLAATGRVRPRTVALAAAAVGLLVASFMLGEDSERLAAIVAVATAAGIVAYALLDRSWVLVAIGLAGFFLAMTMAMQTVLPGMGARLLAVLVGLAVVGAVAVRAQRSARRDRR